jgi:hypothetical protein
MPSAACRTRGKPREEANALIGRGSVVLLLVALGCTQEGAATALAPKGITSMASAFSAASVLGARSGGLAERRRAARAVATRLDVREQAQRSRRAVPESLAQLTQSRVPRSVPPEMVRAARINVPLPGDRRLAAVSVPTAVQASLRAAGRFTNAF